MKKSEEDNAESHNVREI